MNEAEQQKRVSTEAERLRTDTAFAAATKTIHAQARAKLTELSEMIAEAVVLEKDTSQLRAEIIQQRATTQAIEALTTEIAHMILRGRDNNGPDIA